MQDTPDILDKLRQAEPIAKGPYRRLIIDAADEIERLRALIAEWADAEDGIPYDIDDPWANLRKAIGR